MADICLSCNDRKVNLVYHYVWSPFNQDKTKTVSVSGSYSEEISPDDLNCPEIYEQIEDMAKMYLIKDALDNKNRGYVLTDIFNIKQDLMCRPTDSNHLEIEISLAGIA